MNMEIENLFKTWYKKQCENENQANSSFIYDGSLSDGNLNEHEILFVCRESHDTNEKIKNDFWFKNVVEGFETNGKKYYNCINLIIDYINKEFEPENEDIELKNCAYMNINKKGGSSSCDFNFLNEYAKEYKEFIIKEIEILNPKRIVILGKLYKAKSAEDIFYEYGRKHNVKVYIYDRHPSIYSKDIKKHLYLNVPVGHEC